MPEELDSFASAMRACLPDPTLWSKVMEAFRAEILRLQAKAEAKEKAYQAKAVTKKPRRNGKYCDHWKDPKKREDYEKALKKREEEAARLKKRPSNKDLKSTDKRPKSDKKPKRSTGTEELVDEAYLANSHCDPDDADDSEMDDSSDEPFIEYDSESDDDQAIFYVNHCIRNSMIDCLNDSGASRHMCANKNYFRSLRPLTRTTRIKVGNGQKIPTTAIGDVVLTLNMRNAEHAPGEATIRRVIIRNVLYVPGLMANLLSSTQLALEGVSTEFVGRQGPKNIPLRALLTHGKTKKVVATATLKDGQWCLDLAHTRSFVHRALTVETRDDEKLETVQSEDTDEGSEMSITDSETTSSDVSMESDHPTSDDDEESTSDDEEESTSEDQEELRTKTRGKIVKQMHQALAEP